MGFYKSNERNPSNQRSVGASWRVGGLMLLSALVGAGATVAITPVVFHGMISQMVSSQGFSVASPGATSSTPATPVNVSITDGITQVVKKVEPAVVAVVNYTTTTGFFTNQTQTQASDIGSGVYFYRDGQSAYVVTNNHVVQGGSKVEVVLKSGKHVPATVVGTDPYSDLAVLKVAFNRFANAQPIPFANSTGIQVGEPAIAIGNPMGLDFADSVTSGIVSGDQRMMPVEEPTSQQTLDYQPVIQTDAAINPGNSGGPLLNIQGQLIGINSSKIVATDFSGMGFAIPSNEVRSIALQLLQKGYAVHPSLGIEAVDVSNIAPGYGPTTPVDYGVYVQSVVSKTAKAGGLKQGDVIVSLNGSSIQNSADLRTALFSLSPGQSVKVTLYRGNKKLTLSVQIGAEHSPNTTSPSYNSNGSNGSGQNPFTGGGNGGNPFGNFFGNFFGG